eukprot:12702517-Prorocentrum_lima.AAC.1
MRTHTPTGNIKWIIAHAPHMGREEDEKEDFYRQIKETIQKHPRDKIIILGDFNAEVNWMEV